MFIIIQKTTQVNNNGTKSNQTYKYATINVTEKNIHVKHLSSTFRFVS